MITLTDQQLQEVLNHKSIAQEGMNQILGMVLNTIMYSERHRFLKEQKEPHNKANGFRPIKVKGYGRQLSLAIPRDRLGMFQPLLMLTLKEEEEAVQSLCFELYREGLTTRRLSKVMEKIYGKKYSKSVISDMSQTFKEELGKWRERPLEEQYLVVYLDAIQSKVRREHLQGEAFYIALGVRQDKTREVLAISNNPIESASGWKEVLKKLQERGVKKIDLIVADGITGLEEKVLTQFPKAKFQKCVTHLKRHILYQVRASDKQAIAVDLANLFRISDNCYTKKEAYKLASEIIHKWKKYPFLKQALDAENLRTYLTCLDFDFRIRPMIYTTNWIERLNKEFRRALKIRDAMPSVDAVLLLLSAIAREMEQGTYAYPTTLFNYEKFFKK